MAILKEGTPLVWTWEIVDVFDSAEDPPLPNATVLLHSDRPIPSYWDAMRAAAEAYLREFKNYRYGSEADEWNLVLRGWADGKQRKAVDHPFDQVLFDADYIRSYGPSDDAPRSAWNYAALWEQIQSEHWRAPRR